MQYRNPIYTSDGRIDCEINHPLHGWIPFTADPNDTEAHGRELFSLISLAGGIAEYTPVPISDEVLAEQIRSDRNQLLRDSDWTQLPDIPESTRLMWATYRQSLRDIPLQTGFPRNVDWPTTPK